MEHWEPQNTISTAENNPAISIRGAVRPPADAA
jgi:hypothetical protein